MEKRRQFEWWEVILAIICIIVIPPFLVLLIPIHIATKLLSR